MGSVRPNVLLVILDSLRARNTTLSGYRRETTPFLSELAESATTYTQARAPGSRSLPSHASIFTGHPPQEHGLHTLSERFAPAQQPSHGSVTVGTTPGCSPTTRTSPTSTRG